MLPKSGVKYAWFRGSVKYTHITTEDFAFLSCDPLKHRLCKIYHLGNAYNLFPSFVIFDGKGSETAEEETTALKA